MRSPSNLISTKELDSPLDQLSAAAVRYRIAVGPPLAFELENEVDLVDGYRRAAAEEFPRTIDHDITRSIYGFDPDGNAVEIYADMTREWRTERTGVVTKPTPQWTPREPPPRAERLYHESPEIRRVEGAILHPTRITHVVLVNITSLRKSFCDKTVVLDPGEHPFIAKRSVVNYPDAKELDLNTLNSALNQSLDIICVQKESCSSDLLKKIREGVKACQQRNS